MEDKKMSVDIENAVDQGIEAAAEYVSSLPKGQNRWDNKEYKIAEIAAREAIASLQIEDEK